MEKKEKGRGKEAKRQGEEREKEISEKDIKSQVDNLLVVPNWPYRWVEWGKVVIGVFFPSGWDLMYCVGGWSGIKWC